MAEILNVPEIFGSDVFNEAVMKQRLPMEVYKAWENCIQTGSTLPLDVANEIAEAMKIWALEKGATHYTHWFQPMTGITAEKHDSFISPTGDGRVIMEFSGKELVRGEPDASSFPSGGLRATFEARGYTAWDPTACAFVKDGSLYIPTMFFSYTGDSLDKKTPLLRSLEEVSREAIRILRLFGDTQTHRIITCVGAEQEYFLLPKDLYAQREDLRLTGRTLFGAPAPKGQELDDHYFAAIRTRVSEFMQDLDEQLWRLGILSKTKHNEGAPCQHELAPIYTDANKACDDNQLIMRTMKKCAAKHNLVCLLHEKPFAGVNGSGKHNNWSLSTDSGKNLFSPGKTPRQNAQFLVFLAAFIQGIDEYQEFLRCTVASASNDTRLGANEAPPAVISIFLGDELTAVLDAIETDSAYVGAEKKKMKLGVDVLPRFIRDTTDRNRTSPFAFTGNKFEFRMLGSSNSIACANIMLNAAVAQSLKLYADELEQAEDFNAALHELIKRTITAHKRIIFNGNGYDDTWIREATEKRGLLNLRTTPDAIPELLKAKNIEMLTAQKVYTEAELRSRYEIMLENYCKTVCIEAQTMSDMARKQILPAVAHYAADVARDAAGKKALDTGISCGYEAKLVKKLTAVTESIDTRADALDGAIAKFKTLCDVTEGANFIRDEMLARMTALRVAADEAETLTAESAWPFPTYGDLLFSVK